MAHVPSSGHSGNALHSYFSSHAVNKYSFHSLFSGHFSAFFFFFFVNSLFKIAPVSSAEVLSSIPISKRAVEKIPVIEKFCINYELDS